MLDDRGAAEKGSALNVACGRGDAASACPNLLMMINPEIVKKIGAYEAEEGCAALCSRSSA